MYFVERGTKVGDHDVFGSSIANIVESVVIPKLNCCFGISKVINNKNQHNKVNKLFLLPTDSFGKQVTEMEKYLSFHTQKGCEIYTPIKVLSAVKKYVEVLEEMRNDSEPKFKVKVIGVKKNEAFKLVGNKQIQLIESKEKSETKKRGYGWIIFEEKKKMNPIYKDELKKSKNKKQFIKDHSDFYLIEKVQILSFIPKFLEYSFDDDCKRILNSKSLFINYFDLKTCENNGTKLNEFKGKALVLLNLPDYLCSGSGECNIELFLKPRILDTLYDKLTLLSYRTPKGYHAKNEDCFEIDQEQLKDARKDFPKYDNLEYINEEEFEFRQFLGYAGKKKFQMKKDLVKKYGNDFVKGYLIEKNKHVKREYALHLYEESYFQYLKKNKELLDYIINEAADVYDTEKANIYSGYDYYKQDARKPTHLQDIAIRRVIKRMGLQFKGKRLLQARGVASELYSLNPGFIKFVKPEWINKDNLFTRDWILSDSVECFWQSNKVILTKK